MTITLPLFSVHVGIARSVRFAPRIAKAVQASGHSDHDPCKGRHCRRISSIRYTPMLCGGSGRLPQAPV